MNIVAQFANMQQDRKTLIRKALDSSAGVGGALVPQHLEKTITNTVLRLSPELALLEPEFDPQKLHEYNQLTALPSAGGAMGEGATTPVKNGTYARKSITLKVIRRKGTVTNFLQDASKSYIDAAAAEMENHLQSHVYDLNTYNVWGSAGANAYAWDGLDSICVNDSKRRIVEAVAGVVPASLKFLDDMIDLNLRKQGVAHKKAFLMSPEMQSLTSRLLTNVRLEQDVGVTEIKGGWRLMTYRGIPIVPTSLTSPGGKMGAVTATFANSGGTVADGAYYFRVAYVDWSGESEASDEATVTCSGGAGNAHVVTLAWTAVDGAMFYKVYAAITTSGAEKLVAVLPAGTYLADGTPAANVTGCAISTAPATRNPTVTLSATSGVTTGPTLSVPTATMALDVPYVANAGVVPETVILWDLDKYQGLGKFPYTNQGGSRFNGMVTMELLARTDDNIPFLIKSYGGLCPSFDLTSVIHRGLRVA
jgi:hypothetical protein